MRRLACIAVCLLTLPTVVQAQLFTFETATVPAADAQPGGPAYDYEGPYNEWYKAAAWDPAAPDVSRLFFPGFPSKSSLAASQVGARDAEIELSPGACP